MISFAFDVLLGSVLFFFPFPLLSCFLFAEVAALVVLISHEDQINDLLFAHDGAIKGFFIVSYYLCILFGFCNSILLVVARSFLSISMPAFLNFSK